MEKSLILMVFLIIIFTNLSYGESVADKLNSIGVLAGDGHGNSYDYNSRRNE